MKTVCAWCEPNSYTVKDKVSHGICEPCAERELKAFKESLDNNQKPINPKVEAILEDNIWDLV